MNYYNFALQFEQSFLLFDSCHADTIGISISAAADQSLDFFQLKGFWTLSLLSYSKDVLFASGSHCFSTYSIGHNSSARIDFQKQSTFSYFLNLSPLWNFLTVRTGCGPDCLKLDRP